MIDPKIINYRHKTNDSYPQDSNQKIVELLSNYFQQRGSFLAQVIKADITNSNYLPQSNQRAKNSISSLIQEFQSDHRSHIKYQNSNGGSNHSRNRVAYSYGNGKSQSALTSNKINSEVDEPEAKLSTGVKKKSEQKSHINVEALLIDLIVEQTGYSQETISGELRLLDDLNLDSIKAGELVTNAAQQVGVSGELDPSTLANATIKEVADTIKLYIGHNITEIEAIPNDSRSANFSARKIDIVQLLLDLVEEQTGFPQNTLSAELRLLDDLNLDSIKAGELVANAAQQVGVGGELDSSILANATIAEIAKLLAEVLEAKVPSVTQPQPKVIQSPEEASWVRNFKLEYIAQEIATSEDTNWTTAKVLIICDLVGSSLVTSLETELRGQKAQVTAVSYQELAEKLDGYTHYFAFLPEVAHDDSDLSLESMTTRLKSIATAPKNSFVTYVQFGGGRFGSLGNNIHPEVCNAAAFARSIHLERKDLKVRVIDLAVEIEPTKATALIIQEVSREESIVTAGYDLNLTRWIPQSQVLQPLDYEPRSHIWSADDVILVTGGAKGITAECALAVAESTRAKMALVGRSNNISGEIAQTLQRFADKGLTCQYYACDITDLAAVQKLVIKVNSELGKVTGIIHGAGLNTPRRVEQITLESARKEAAPKLLGAFNLLQALAEQPIKIFAAFSSIIGVTGMAGNTWYAFANESLALLLNRWQQQHPESDVISLAYSVWSEVGMGARMGSVKNLARMGIAAIPPQEGIDRFMGLFKGNPGTNQVVIAARLGG